MTANRNFERPSTFSMTEQEILAQCEVGKQHHLAKDYQKAEAIYLNILNYDYENPNALFLLGTLYQQTEREGLSINLFKRLVDKMGDSSSVYNNLAAAYHVGTFNGEALNTYMLANNLAAGKDPDILGNIGGMFVNVGEPERGLEWFDKALAIDPNHVNSRWNKSLCLLELERFEEGFKEYEYGLQTGDRKYKPYVINGEALPEWQGEYRDCIVICGEQGLGDEIMFSSLLQEVSEMVGKIILDCHPRLKELMAYHEVSLKGKMIVVPGRKELEHRIISEHSPQARINIGSIAKFIRKNRDDFNVPARKGYIHLPNYDVERMRERVDEIGKNKKVGIVWMGGGRRTRSDLRSIPIEFFNTIFSIENVDFVSLQYKSDGREVEAFEKQSGYKIHHIIGDDDLYEHFCLTAALDSVISICTTTAHFCGAIGKKALVAVPMAAAWRYGLKDNRMAWYESVELFRQTEFDKWGNVICAIKRRLKEIL
jgi:tetratricopeptide (TPR) repeat protein